MQPSHKPEDNEITNAFLDAFIDYALENLPDHDKAGFVFKVLGINGEVHLPDDWETRIVRIPQVRVMQIMGIYWGFWGWGWQKDEGY